MVRGIAALMVLVAHVRNLFVVDAHAQQGLSAAQKAFYLLTKQGQPAVCVFFVLSGFLIGTSVVTQMRQERWNWRNYALARLSRLWVVLIPALVLGFALDAVGSRVFSGTPVYAVPHYALMMPESLAASLTPAAFLGNAAFLQTILVPTLGSNGALWSLSNEFWYYALFPLLMLAAWRTTRAARAAGLALALGVLALMPGDMRYLLLVWLMGAALAFAPRVETPSALRWLAGLLLAGFLVVGSAHPLLHGRLILGALTTLYVYSLLTASKAPGAWYRATAERLSGVSYTLYLTHSPLAVFLAAATLRGVRLPANAFGVGAVLAVCAVALAYAAMLWWLFESRTDIVRRWADARLPRGGSASPVLRDRAVVSLSRIGTPAEPVAIESSRD